ncbi:PREDICTED: uncharacterized protein LOC108689841 [Atta colombica]|uniref:uncharacterized protein LOC108689841 n=1 Tax=Atta colombica TaxID=520822 RepID=UPI00084BE8DD|nr:PREDICTED: uncharacterized protein LOC108689841 [Atta colombica]
MDKESYADNNEEAKNHTRCFVCDADVKGRFYALASCRTQNSQARVIEKLGELVGERYMVVITEEDVICRSCGILVNTLDRLEIEMRDTRNHILRFLEQKYSLNEGELRNSSDKPKPCQPPQITRSGVKEITCSTKSNENDSNPGNKKIPSKSLLQCNKCKYTTGIDSFMVYHLRNHTKESLSCDNCGNTMLEVTKHNCNKANGLGNKENETDNSDNVSKNESITLLKPTQILPFTQTTPPPLTSFQQTNCNPPNSIPTLPISDSTSSQEPVYILQSIDMTDTDNLKKITNLDLDLVQKMQSKSKDTKQVLTVKDDGSLLVVEVPVSWKAKAPIINSLTFEQL